MPIRHIEGFRVLPDGSGAIQLGAAGAGTTTTWERAASRTGWGIQQRNSSGGDSSTYRATLTLTPSPAFTGTDLSLAFAAKMPDDANSSVPLLIEIVPTGGTSNPVLTATLKTGSAPIFSTVASGMSAIEQVDATPLTGGWHWFCMTARMNVATGGHYRLYRDGTLVARVEGDTAPTSTYAGNLLRIRIQVPSINSISGVALSDLILRDDITIIPESRVDVLMPTSTPTAQWTPSAGANHQCVDDEPTIDTADYVSSSTVGATDLFGFEPLPYAAPTIDAVELRVRASKSGTGARTVATVVNGVQGTAVDPGPGLGLATTHNTNPSGGAAWTKATVDAVSAGARLVS